MSQSVATDILEPNYENSNETIEYLQNKIEALTQLNLIKDRECREANSLVIKFFQENINLEKELNRLRADYSLLIVDYKEKESFVHELRERLTKKESEIFILRTQLSNKELETQDPVKKRSFSKSQNIAKKIKTIYETNITKSFQDTNNEIEMLCNEFNGDYIKTEKQHVSIQTEPTTDIEFIQDFFYDIDIIEHNYDKKYIRIMNRTDVSKNIGNFELTSFLNGYELEHYKFHKATVLGPRMSLTLWSSNSEFKKHHPPTDFVMTSDKMSSKMLENMLTSKSCNLINDVLLDQNKNEIARSEFLIKLKEENW